jgi:radical SAM protein with 4Fe4S-binding SPASM domain
MENKLYKKWKDSLTITAKEKRVPIAGQFELTPRCNLDCKMCYIHGANSNSLRDQELSTETWMRIFDEAYDMGLMFAVLTGGECLLRHDFKELYLHLWTKRIRITIFTNGILIDDNYVEFFKKYPPEQIRISLYGSCEAAYRNLTGHEGFQKVISAYKKLFEAKIPVGVAVTPSSYMKDDFIHIRRFCLENGIKGHNPNYYLTKNRDFPDKNDHNLTIDEIISLASADKMLRSQLNPNENTPAPCGNCTEAPVGLACGAGRSSALVSWNGIMHPCVSIPEGTASLLEVSYASAWEATKAIVDEMLSGAECVGCPYDSVCHKCPVIRLTSLHSGHCNPDMCELTRRMVAAGIKKLNHKAEECD